MSSSNGEKKMSAKEMIAAVSAENAEIKSARGRKPTTAPTIEKPVINHEDVQLGTMALEIQAERHKAAQENALVLAEQLGYEGALTVTGLEEEIRFYQRRSVEAVLETGKRLLLLKEVCPHGEFAPSLERLGIGERMAQKFMVATLKFSNASSTTLLSLPNLNQGKLLELLVLDEGDIEALDQGDTVRGVKLDDIDCMSVSELRRALRTASTEHAAELADKDRVIAQKSNKIEELVEDKNRRERMTDAEKFAEMEQLLTEATLVSIGDMQVIRRHIQDIRSEDKTPHGVYMACANSLQRVVSEAMGIAADWGIALTLAAEPDDEVIFDDPNADEDLDDDLNPQAV